MPIGLLECRDILGHRSLRLSERFLELSDCDGNRVAFSIWIVFFVKLGFGWHDRFTGGLTKVFMTPNAQHKFEGVTEQGKASLHRMTDARALLDARRWRGAMYMAGYSVECLLKSKLMKMYLCSTLSELEEQLINRKLLSQKSTIYTHQVEKLLELAGGLERVRKNQEHSGNLTRVNTWIPAWRYNPKEPIPEDAKSFLDAVDALTGWITNSI